MQYSDGHRMGLHRLRSRSGVTLALCALGLSAVHGDDWTGWRGTNGDGITAEADWDATAVSGSPTYAWKTNVGAGWSSVCVSAGRLYTMGNQGGQDVVYCLGAADGKEQWRMSYPCLPGNYPGP